MNMKKEKKMRVGVAYPAFFRNIKDAFPNDDVEKVDTSKNIVKDYDLIVFTGGEDINPAYYNEHPTYTNSWNDSRDSLEYAILKTAYGKTKILGICRGFQFISAFSGSSIVQDITLCGFPSHGGGHKLNFLTSSPSKIDCFSTVNSLHHQGVKNISTSKFRVIAAYGGLIEAIENDKAVAVQFHPEMMYNNESKEFFSRIRGWVMNKPEKEEKKLSTSDIKDFYRINYSPLPHENYDEYMERVRREKEEQERAIGEIRGTTIANDTSNWRTTNNIGEMRGEIHTGDIRRLQGVIRRTDNPEVEPIPDWLMPENVEENNEENNNEDEIDLFDDEEEQN